MRSKLIYAKAEQRTPEQRAIVAYADALDFLLPLTTRKHLSFVATRKYPGGSELILAYMHSFREDVKGPGASAGVDVHDRINWPAIGFGYRFRSPWREKSDCHSYSRGDR